MTSPVDRRQFLAAVAATATASIAGGQASSPSTAGRPAPAGQAAAPAGPFTLPPLPYPAEALEPSIDAETMRIHHGKHHQAYVTNLNKALDGISAPTDVELLIADLNAIPTERRTAVRNNAGGHANHTLFWKTLAPKGKGGAASPELAAAIERDLGGLEKLKEAMNAAGLGRFGSGWSWLIVTPDGKLAVTSTPNQDSPLMGQGYVDQPGVPLFGIDVWEHAYYLKYQNRRADYVKAIWEIVNWDEVSRQFAAATSKR
jgi:Fe-Mn family superoxide dismutase